jgi:hypothetical protein
MLFIYEFAKYIQISILILPMCLLEVTKYLNLTAQYFNLDFMARMVSEVTMTRLYNILFPI